MPSIIRCDEIADGRSASDNFEYKGEATRTWRVRTDDNSIDAVEVLDNAHLSSPDPIALIGAVHPSSSILYCKSRNCVPDGGGDGDDGKVWKVTATYDNQFKEDPAERQSNPLDRAVRYSLDWVQFTRALVKDAEGDDIVNSAGDPFDPIELDDSRPVLVAVRNEDAAGLAGIIALAIDYKDAVNSDTFYGAPAGSCKMGLIQTGEIQYENGVSFYSVRYEFQFKEVRDPAIDAWDLELLDEGPNALRTANSEATKYEVDNKKIVKLKADGTIKGPTDAVHYVDFPIYPRRAFGALGL